MKKTLLVLIITLLSVSLYLLNNRNARPDTAKIYNDYKDQDALIRQLSHRTVDCGPRAAIGFRQVNLVWNKTAWRPGTSGDFRQNIRFHIAKCVFHDHRSGLTI